MSCTQEEIEKHCNNGKLEMEKVLTPEWGVPGFVYVRGLMAPESDSVFRLTGEEHADEAARRRTSMAAWTVVCACDDKGVRIFSDDRMAFLTGPKSPLAALYRCAMKAIDVNGLSEDLAGNLKETQKGNSP